MISRNCSKINKKEVETELLMHCRHFVYNLELNSRKTESECCEKNIRSSNMGRRRNFLEKWESI